LAHPELSERERLRHEVMLWHANDQLRRVVWVEGVLTELCFYFVVYGKSEKEITERISDLIRLGGRELGLCFVVCIFRNVTFGIYIIRKIAKTG